LKNYKMSSLGHLTTAELLVGNLSTCGSTGENETPTGKHHILNAILGLATIKRYVSKLGTTRPTTLETAHGGSPGFCETAIEAGAATGRTLNFDGDSIQ